MSAPATNPRPTMLGTLGWAAFLACSWTWCIGMFLPILFTRDYGPWSIVVFAAPNILGAGAFGWVLAHRDASARFVARHRIACRIFSQATIAFQVFFLLWLWAGIPGLGEPLRTSGLGGAAVWIGVLAGVLVLIWPIRPGLRVAVVLWCASAVVLFIWLTRGLPETAPLPPVPAGSTTGLILLAPVIVFGFLLCPYLDLTFHQARQGTTRLGARWAFSIGFGVLFLAMILGTLAYAPLVLSPRNTGTPSTLPALLVTLHIVAQLLYTIGVHHRADARVAVRGDRAITLIGLVLLALAFAGVIAAAFLPRTLPGLGGLSVPETVYLVFMSLYGLAFPAYVWLCVIPTRDGTTGPTRASLRVWALTVGIVAPMYWVGFIMGHELMLLVGQVVVLFARLALPGGPGLPRRNHTPDESARPS